MQNGDVPKRMTDHADPEYRLAGDKGFVRAACKPNGLEMEN